MATTVPENAKGPPRDFTDGLAVEEVGDRLFLATDGDYQSLFSDTDEGVIAFDAPWGHELADAIRRVTRAKITHIVYSHSHYDHIRGAAHLHPAHVVAHSQTERILRRHSDDRRPVPSLVFDEAMTLEIGGVHVELAYRGPNHQDGNIFIYFPLQRVLMLVDVIVPGWVPFLALGGATDVAAYLDAHDMVQDYDFETLVAGHLTRTGTVMDVRVQKEYLMDVHRACTQARQSVSPVEIAAATGFEDKWQFANTYFDRLAATAANEVVPRWVDRLGGVAAFTKSHCLAMAIALAHEWGIEPGT